MATTLKLIASSALEARLCEEALEEIRKRNRLNHHTSKDQGPQGLPSLMKDDEESKEDREDHLGHILWLLLKHHNEDVSLPLPFPFPFSTATPQTLHLIFLFVCCCVLFRPFILSPPSCSFFSLM